MHCVYYGMNNYLQSIGIYEEPQNVVCIPNYYTYTNIIILT